VNKRAAFHVALFVRLEPVHDPPKPVHDPPNAVFFDPSGRRRRVLVVLLLSLAATATVVVFLLITGLRGGPPRISVEPEAVPSMTGSVTPHPPAPHPSDLPPLPNLPAVP
jgi:hypothetical protein